MFKHSIVTLKQPYICTFSVHFIFSVNFIVSKSDIHYLSNGGHHHLMHLMQHDIISQVYDGESYWHHKCFVCGQCNSSLVNTKYYDKSGSLYCNNCFLAEHLPTCFRCGVEIKGRGEHQYAFNVYMFYHT